MDWITDLFTQGNLTLGLVVAIAAYFFFPEARKLIGRFIPDNIEKNLDDLADKLGVSDSDNVDVNEIMDAGRTLSSRAVTEADKKAITGVVTNQLQQLLK